MTVAFEYLSQTVWLCDSR